MKLTKVIKSAIISAMFTVLYAFLVQGRPNGIHFVAKDILMAIISFLGMLFGFAGFLFLIQAFLENFLQLDEKESSECLFFLVIACFILCIALSLGYHL